MTFSFTPAERAAQNILKMCGLDDPTELPISEIILGRNAYYQESPLEAKDGEIVTVGSKSIITVNSDIPWEAKKRFAAAHELGHYEMHRKLSSIFIDTEEDLLNWYQGGPQEMEANEFASEFLMPTDIFYAACKGRKFGPSVIDHLANRFQVSKTATILKFVRAGNHPVCVVYCKDNKMKWWKRSHDFRYFLEFNRDNHPPTGSVAYEIFTAKKIYLGDESKQQIWRSDWFRMRDDDEDSKFFEYCLFAKAYNYTISIIWEE